MTEAIGIAMLLSLCSAVWAVTRVSTPRERAVRVLVADDMPIVRKLCAAILRGAGHDVFEAQNGSEALALYQADRHDAILLDLRMPEMDGVDVLRALSTADVQAHVIIITAGTDAEIREAISLGARTIVLKPFSREHILGALSRTISHRHAGNGNEIPVKFYSWTGLVNVSQYA
jgi:two-component system cell cycle response regulator